MITEVRSMAGHHIVLEPLSEVHRNDLKGALDCDEEHWRILPRSGAGEHLSGYWQAIRGNGRIPFGVRSLFDGSMLGTSSYSGIDAANATLEIRATWFGPEHRGTVVNAEAKLLMLSHAFEAGGERVQFSVDARNVGSRRAVAKLGATEEGLLRSTMTTWTGHRRDTVVFSMLRSEWQAVRAGLLQRLA